MSIRKEKGVFIATDLSGKHKPKMKKGVLFIPKIKDISMPKTKNYNRAFGLNFRKNNY